MQKVSFPVMGRPRSRQPGPYRDFGIRFEESLEDAGLSGSPADIGRRFGVGPTTIGNWIHGDKLPSMENAILIARATDVSVDWLLTGRGEKRTRMAASGSLDISHLSSGSQAAIRALVHSLEDQGLGDGEEEFG